MLMLDTANLLAGWHARKGGRPGKKEQREKSTVVHQDQYCKAGEGGTAQAGALKPETQPAFTEKAKSLKGFRQHTTLPNASA